MFFGRPGRTGRTLSHNPRKTADFFSWLSGRPSQSVVVQVGQFCIVKIHRVEWFLVYGLERGGETVSKSCVMRILIQLRVCFPGEYPEGLPTSL